MLGRGKKFINKLGESRNKIVKMASEFILDGSVSSLYYFFIFII